jgi:hypothetical protein
MTKLYIDDIREPYNDDFVVVRSYAEAVGWLRKNGCPQFISFDHDLGEADARSGYDVAKWMVERDLNDNGKFIPDTFNYNVHSANPVGAENIRGLLDSYMAMKAAPEYTNDDA